MTTPMKHSAGNPNQSIIIPGPCSEVRICQLNRIMVQLELSNKDGAMKISRRQVLYSISTAAAVYATYKLAPVSWLGLTHQAKNPAKLFQWHVDNFLTRAKQLTEVEKTYINQALAITEQNGFQINQDIFYSGYSFSHRIQGDSIDSNRFAVGGYSQKQKIQEFAAKVLAEKNIQADTWAANDKIIGLGWDLEQEHFKIYWHYEDLMKLENPQLQELMTKINRQDYYPFGLVSVTFKKNEPIEHKVYLAMTATAMNIEKTKFPFADEIIHINHMVTNLRGVVPQLDLRGEGVAKILPSPAQRIISQYKKLGLSVDTITYEDAQKHTLYFGG